MCLFSSAFECSSMYACLSVCEYSWLYAYSWGFGYSWECRLPIQSMQLSRSIAQSNRALMPGQSQPRKARSPIRRSHASSSQLCLHYDPFFKFGNCPGARFYLIAAYCDRAVEETLFLCYNPGATARRGARVVDRGGLENRCGSLGSPWVRIPASPPSRASWQLALFCWIHEFLESHE